ncbi:MAG: cyclodeaminase/cyclohydrolase family protein [Aeromicrobium sp.]
MSGPEGAEELLQSSVRQLLDDVGARTTAPGGGAVTGIVAALAGALATMCGRFADGESISAGRRAEELQAKAASLAEADPIVYEAYVRARREQLDAATVTAALDEAIRVPLEMAEVAAELVQIASELARSGNPRLRGDALTAMFLAAAATRSAAALVGENLPDTEVGDDPRLERAATLVASVGATEQEARSV